MSQRKALLGGQNNRIPEVQKEGPVKKLSIFSSPQAKNADNYASYVLSKSN